jgi:LacI family transcriptional regulator, repressor for deo operon, udp, cdd, tsx, nupC, and nupG
MAAPRSVTIKDVARAAGVSPATVSVVVNGSGGRLRIAPATQERVLAAAHEMGYVADPRVQALRRGRTRTVLMAFVARQVPDAFFVDILRALDHGAAQRGRDAQFHLVREEGGWEALRGSAKAAAGVILVGSPPPHQTVPLRALPVPLVQVGSGDPLPGAAVVRVDNRLAGRRVAEHLLRLGHREIAVLGPRQWYAPFVERRGGLLKSLESGGARVPLVLSAPEPDHETIAQLRAARVTAVVCLYDRLALGLLREARLAGIGVPAEWSVAGFDDMDWSALLAPSLTTVRIPRARMAAAALAQLEALLEGRSPAPVVLSPDLIVRESTSERPQ